MGSFAIGPVAATIASLIFVVLIASGDGALGKFYNINFNLFNLIRMLIYSKLEDTNISIIIPLKI